MTSRLPFGPVLYWRGTSDGRWEVAIMIGAASGSAPPALEIEGRYRDWEPIGAFEGITFHRADTGPALSEQERVVPYGVGGERFAVTLPGRQRLRLAFMTCNGQERKTLEQTEADPRRNALWREMAAVHGDRPLHLLLHGGDQLYADMVWKRVPELAALDRRWSMRKVAHATLSAEALARIRAYYHCRYLRLWTQPDIRPLLAAVPSAMMWDDHDIFDGWGSHLPELGSSPAFLGLYKQAREAFQLFQLARRDGEAVAGHLAPDGHHFSWLYRAGPLAVLAPDLRSTRTRRRVMDERVWQDLERAMGTLDDAETLVLVSSVPIVNLGLAGLERVLDRVRMPILYHRHFIKDDLRDQWQSPYHAAEWARLIRLLAGFAERPGRSVVVLSGEVHYGAFGHAELGNGARLCQLISSGIAHPPPRAATIAAWRLFGRVPDPGVPGVRLAMDDVPGWGRPMLRRRNWLELEVGRAEGTCFRWHADGCGGLAWARCPNAAPGPAR